MSEENAPILLREGIAAAQAGNKTHARQALLRVVQLEPRNETAWLWLAGVVQNPKDVVTCLSRVLEINPANPHALKGLEAAKVKTMAARVPPAARCPFCQSVLEQKEQCSACGAILSISDLDKLLGNALAKKSVLHSAVSRLQSQINQKGDDAGSHFQIGLAYLNLSQLDPALTHFYQALKLRPDHKQLAQFVALLAERQSSAPPPAPAPAAVTTAPPIAAVPRPTVNPEPVSASVPTVLIVDDSATVRKLVTITLEKRGYRVLAAADGLEGMTKLSELHPDLILLDITMPRIDGYQLCKLIKGNAESRDIPVVMLSGKDGLVDKVRGRMAGSTDYITKPFQPDELLQIVSKHAIRRNGQG